MNYILLLHTPPKNAMKMEQHTSIHLKNDMVTEPRRPHSTSSLP